MRRAVLQRLSRCAIRLRPVNALSSFAASEKVCPGLGCTWLGLVIFFVI